MVYCAAMNIILIISLLVPMGIVPAPELNLPSPIEVLQDTLCYAGDEVIGAVKAGDIIHEWTDEGDYYGIELYGRGCLIDKSAEREPLPIPEWTLKQVVRWQEYAEEAGAYYGIDPILILAVIGKESAGNYKAISSDGYSSVGLMQITPADWGCRSNELLDWPKINIYCGTLILQDAIKLAQEVIDSGYVAPNGFTPQDPVRVGLAAYNCSFASLYGTNGKSCYLYGGLAYADEILNLWMPTLELYMSGLDN